MKVAIIENEENFINGLKQLLHDTDWDVEFYLHSIDFNNADLSSLNVIIVNQNLYGITGKELLYSIHKKTSADLYLMSESLGCFLEKGVQNGYIKGLIKRSIQSIITKLQYIEVKLRICQLAETEENNITSIVDKANGYSFKIENDIGFIALQAFIASESKRNLFKKIKNSNVDKMIVSYPERKYLSPMHYKQLLEMCEFFKHNGNKITFWNIGDNTIIKKVLRDCKLDKIIPIFNNSERAIEFLNNI